MMLLPLVASAQIDPCLGIDSNGLIFDANHNGFVATLGEPFDAPKLDNDYNVSPIVWTSSNPAVATVDDNGNVTLVGVGRTHIAATFDGNDQYKAVVAEYDLVVVGSDTDSAGKADPSLGISSNGQNFDESRGGFIATLGEPFNSLELSNPFNVSPIIWSSSNTKVATVDENGIVTIVGVGKTRIVATFAGNDEYKAGQVGYDLVVEGNSDTDPDSNPDTNPDSGTDTDSNPDIETDPVTKTDPGLAINSNEHWVDGRGFVATLGKPFNSPVLSNPYSVGPILWTSTNTAVATVDAYGVITLVGAGETQIIATFAGNDEYKAAKAEYHLEVDYSDTDTDTDPDPDTNTNDSGSTTYMIMSEGTVAVSHNEQSGDVIINKTTIIDGKTYQVTTIAENAFKDNQAIRSVLIPEGISSIGENAFYGCINLQHVNLYKDVNRIDQRAFANIGTTSSARTRGDNSNLIFICNAERIPQTAENAFEGTDIANAKLRVPGFLVKDYKESSPWSGFGTIEPIPGTDTVTVSKTIHLEEAGTLSLYISEEEKYTITGLILSGRVNGADLRLIREMAGCDFEGNSTNGKLSKLDMTDVIIFNGGETKYYSDADELKTHVLGCRMFYGCNKLQEIKLPQSIIAIEDEVFRGASNLNSLVIPKSVQKIGTGVLAGCNSIKILDADPDNENFYTPSGSNGVIRKSDNTLVLGCRYTQMPENSVTAIGIKVFAEINFGNNLIKIPEGVKTIKRSAFTGSSFKSIELPEGLETIERDAFEYSSFKNIELREGLKTIGSGAFRGLYMNGPQKMTIPSTVIAFGDSVFIWNNDLKVIVSKIKDPSQVEYGDMLFCFNEYYSVLYVPKGSFAAYESSQYWGYRHFEKIVEGDPEDENSGTSISAILAPQPNRDEYFNLQGQRVETPTKGLYIKNGRKIFIK